MSFKEEYPAMGEVTKPFMDIFKDSYFNYYPFYRGELVNPTLKEIRRKIVLFGRILSNRLPRYSNIGYWSDNNTFSTTTNGPLPLQCSRRIQRLL